jgi:cytochrome oxidase assembly protein ShyY1
VLPDRLARPLGLALAPRNWPIHLLALVGVAACILLGRWQLHVWQSHRADNAAAVTRLAPVPLDSVLGPDAAYPDVGLGRPVVVDGTWVPAQSVLVSGREQGDATGYWVVTPVLTSSGSEIPVVRGWLPDAHDVPAAPRGQASLVGLLQPSDDSGPPDQNTHDRVIPALSITSLLTRTRRDLYGGYVVATDRTVPHGATVAGMAGLTPADPPRLPGAEASTALRNLLYALQWWVFAGFVVFMWWRWLVEDVLTEPGGEAEPASTEGADRGSSGAG